MYTIFHLKSAEEINSDIIEAIKKAFKSKPITLTVEEETDETAYLLANPANKAVLMKSVAEDKNGQHVSVNIPQA